MLKLKVNDASYRRVRRHAESMVLRVQKAGNRSAVRKATAPILKESKRRAPVETGELKRSLVSRVKTERNGVVFGYVGGRKGTAGGRIVHLLELGTSKMAPRPFLRPAIAAAEDDAVAKYKESIWSDVQREARKAAAKS